MMASNTTTSGISRGMGSTGKGTTKRASTTSDDKNDDDDDEYGALKRITSIVDPYGKATFCSNRANNQSLSQSEMEEILVHLGKFPQLTIRKFNFHMDYGPPTKFTAGNCLLILVCNSAKTESLDECIELYGPKKVKALQKTVDALEKLSTPPKFTMTDDSGLIWLLNQCYQKQYQEEVDPTELILFFLRNWNRFINTNNKKKTAGFIMTLSNHLFNNNRPTKPITLTRLHLEFNIQHIGDLIRCRDRVIITSLTLTDVEDVGGVTTNHLGGIIPFIKNQPELKHLAISGNFTYDRCWIEPFCDALATHCPQLGTLNLVGGNITPGTRSSILQHEKNTEIYFMATNYYPNKSPSTLPYGQSRRHRHHVSSILQHDDSAAAGKPTTCWEIDSMFSQFTKKCPSLVHLNVVGYDWMGLLYGEVEESRPQYNPPMIIISSDLIPWIRWKQTLSSISYTQDELKKQFKGGRKTCLSCYETAMQNWWTCQGRQRASKDLGSLLQAILDPPQLGSIVDKCSLPEDTKEQLKNSCSALDPWGEDLLLFNLNYNLLRQHACLWSSTRS